MTSGMHASGMRSGPGDRSGAEYAEHMADLVVDPVVTPVAAAPRPSLRDRKKDATRQLIEDVAWRLFIEHGYEATTVQDIADAANVAPRTFFRYYPTKEAVLYPEIDDLLDDIRTAFEARPRTEPPLVSLIAALDAISSELSEDREKKFQRFEMMKKAKGNVSATSAFVTARIADAVEEMMRRRLAGEPDGEMQARVAAGILTVVLTISNEQWLASGATTNMEDEAKVCFETIRRLIVGGPPSA